MQTCIEQKMTTLMCEIQLRSSCNYCRILEQKNLYELNSICKNICRIETIVRNAQQTFTFSESTIETLEKDVN